MKNVEQTIISQYASSPTITSLVHKMNEWIRPDADIDNFYNFIFDVSTAQGFGLDIWGRIVGLTTGREILTTPTTTVLTDAQFLPLIMLKALANISASTIPAINQLLRNWMSGRGRCYCNDLGNMEISYVFEFFLQPFEIVILQTSGIFLRPAGVGGIILPTTFPVFGFKEMGTTWATPFGQAPFAVTYAID